MSRIPTSETKGRDPYKKVVFFRALPELAKYDSNDGNFDDYDEKITKKHTNIMTFQQKCTNLRDF